MYEITESAPKCEIEDRGKRGRIIQRKRTQSDSYFFVNRVEAVDSMFWNYGPNWNTHVSLVIVCCFENGNRDIARNSQVTFLRFLCLEIVDPSALRKKKLASYWNCISSCISLFMQLLFLRQKRVIHRRIWGNYRVYLFWLNFWFA